MVRNLGGLMKQAQKMQAKLAKLQEELEKREVEASAGGGMVKVTATGKQEITKIIIEPDVVDKEDIEMLQDLIIAAVNEALRKSKEMLTEEMGKITGGLNIPGLF